MEIDPMDMVEKDEPASEQPENKRQKDRNDLNTYVAISVALLATFMGICGIKDNNIVQGMQQAQADRNNDWVYYQARNIREEIAKSTLTQLQIQPLPTEPKARTLHAKKILEYQDLADRQGQKKAELEKKAQQEKDTYDELNSHDDQFDLSDAALSLAISLLAITSLSQKRWLFMIAMIPTVFGVVMGFAGLLGWKLHPDALIKPLTQSPQMEWRVAHNRQE
jgi:Domain of unknown function (DUF4337)